MDKAACTAFVLSMHIAGCSRHPQSAREGLQPESALAGINGEQLIHPEPSTYES